MLGKSDLGDEFELADTDQVRIEKAPAVARNETEGGYEPEFAQANVVELPKTKAGSDSQDTDPGRMTSEDVEGFALIYAIARQGLNRSRKREDSEHGQDGLKNNPVPINLRGEGSSEDCQQYQAAGHGNGTRQETPEGIAFKSLNERSKFCFDR
jgi:hypothetical protein